MRRAIFQTVILGLLVGALLFPFGEEKMMAGGSRQQQQGQQPPTTKDKPQVQISVQSGVVNVEAVVTDNDGNFLPNLKKENFRVLEDGKPQIITNFTPAGEAPITIVILVEFRANMYTMNYYANLTKYWASAFLNNVKKSDWIALEDFDLKTRVDVDFTHDPMEVLQGMQAMTVPLYSEACLFDALCETLDRLQDVKGKKAILAVASGFDTFSKHTLDTTLKRIRQSDTAIYTIGTSQVMADDRGALAGINTQQAQNQMRAFAEMTGGQGWTPEFDGQIPEIMRTVAASLRSQYSLGYAPPAADGKYHKIKVELTAPDGGPLTVVDQKGKKRKFVVYARQGYTAPAAAAGN